MAKAGRRPVYLPVDGHRKEPVPVPKGPRLRGLTPVRHAVTLRDGSGKVRLFKLFDTDVAARQFVERQRTTRPACRRWQAQITMYNAVPQVVEPRVETVADRVVRLNQVTDSALQADWVYRRFDRFSSDDAVKLANDLAAFLDGGAQI